jgi:hypothetical protein
MIRTKLAEIIEDQNVSADEKSVKIIEFLNSLGLGLGVNGFLLDDDLMLSRTASTERPVLGVDLEPIDLGSGTEPEDATAFYVYYKNIWLGSIYKLQSKWGFRFSDDTDTLRVAEDQYLAAKYLRDFALESLSLPQNQELLAFVQ